jgi:hypothetical protein
MLTALGSWLQLYNDNMKQKFCTVAMQRRSPSSTTTIFRDLVMDIRGTSLFSIVSRKVLGPNLPLIYTVPKARSLFETRQGCEAHHSPPSSADARMGEL